jgi:aspartokinase-like uncharacterized kinase
MPFYVLKLGGSLIDSAKSLVSKLSALSGSGYSFLVVPGGGPMADLVRSLYAKGRLSEEAAHWMAILAMEQYAYMLADGTGANLTANISRSNGLNILLPYRPLQEDDRGLEHTWDYTSDSVAALVAARLESDLIKATDVDGVIIDGKVAGVISSASLLGKRTCIDQGCLKLLRGRRAWVLNGSDPDRFVESILMGRGGTIIIG